MVVVRRKAKEKARVEQKRRLTVSGGRANLKLWLFCMPEGTSIQIPQRNDEKRKKEKEKKKLGMNDRQKRTKVRKESVTGVEVEAAGQSFRVFLGGKASRTRTAAQTREIVESPFCFNI